MQQYQTADTTSAAEWAETNGLTRPKQQKRRVEKAEAKSGGNAQGSDGLNAPKGEEHEGR